MSFKTVDWILKEQVKRCIPPEEVLSDRLSFGLICRLDSDIFVIEDTDGKIVWFDGETDKKWRILPEEYQVAVRIAGLQYSILRKSLNRTLWSLRKKENKKKKEET